MNFIRRAIDQARDLYRRMSYSQRWSTGLALLTILVSLILLVVWTGRVDMVPLLLGAPPDVTHRVIQNLESKSVPYEYRGNVLYVAADRKDRLELDLVGEGLFPDGQDVFSWVYDPDITETKGKREMKYLRSLTRRLQVMIESLGPVKSARVEITPAPQSVFLTQAEPAKAAVTLQMHAGQKLKKETALAIARTVAATDRTLKPEHVTIVDTDGNYYPIPDERDLIAFTTNQLESKRNWEEHYQQKAVQLLQFLGKKIVTVDVTLDFETKREHSRVLDPERTVPVEERERTRNTQGFPFGGQPGLDSNLGLSTLPLVTGTGEKVAPATDNQNESEVRSETSFTETDRSKPPGEVKDVTFAVIVDKDELASRQTTVEQIQVDLAKHVPGRDVKKVSVTTVSFAPPPSIPSPTAAEQFEELQRKYGDQAILLVLILAALAMVSWVVRRALPRDALAELERARAGLREEQALSSMEPAEPPTDLAAEQMKGRLQSMVQENPRTAAALLRRWIVGNRE